MVVFIAKKSGGCGLPLFSCCVPTFAQMSHREDLRDFLGAELADLDVFVHLLQNGFTRSNLIALISVRRYMCRTRRTGHWL